MNTRRSLAINSYHLLLVIIAACLLMGVTIFAPPPLVWSIFFVILLVGLLYNFPIRVLSNELNLIHMLTAGTGLIYGPSLAGWAVVFGIGLGLAARRFGWYGGGKQPVAREHWINAAYAAAVQIIPLTLSLLVFNWTGGVAGRTEPVWPAALAPLLVFVLLHAVLILVDMLLYLRQHADARQGLAAQQRELIFLTLMEVVPLPFVTITVVAYQEVGIGSLLTLGSIPALLAVFIHGFSSASTNLERRVQELSTLNQISRVLRSTLDLDSLLTVIHVQVTQLLKVDNFYVALYDLNEKRVWYPLAVKHGQRQNWAPRPLMPDRLTDRVIKEGEHILITPQTNEGLERAGLPSSEENPYAWMGVPLITSDRTIGCLAVFSTSAEVCFTQSDLSLLTTLSGQVSVAIENALLYEQAQRRGAQLETLNRISALISGSLDPKEVLEQVCSSVAEVGGGQHSAIFLLDADKGKVFLAHAFGLSESFSKANEVFPVSQNERMRALRTAQPVMAPSLSVAPLDMNYVESLQKEGIRAFGEFPLTTHDGQIGFLAVYFDAPHTFKGEEVELLQTFASQAAMAVSNARLYAHVDRALSRRVHQLSILEAVGRELAAAINSDRLFEIILDYALNFTNSRCGELSLLNPQLRIMEVKAARGYKESRRSFSTRDGLSGRSISTQTVVYVPDIKTEPVFIDLSGGMVASHLSVPLIHEERVLGVLSIESDQLDAYTSNDRAFISQLATQAAVAVVNAELYSETQRRLREQSTLYLVSTRLVSNPDLDSVLETLTRSMDATLRPSSVGVYFWDAMDELYKSVYSVRSADNTDCSLPETVLYADLETYHPSLTKTGPLRISPKKGRELLAECEECQALVFPLIASKQRLGMVLLHVPKKQAVTEEDLQLLRAIVSQVSISLHNALLFSDISHGRDRMAAVLNSVGEGILMLDPNGRIVLVNEFIQSLTALPKEDLLGQRLASLPASALLALGYTPANLENGDGSQKTTIKVSDSLPEKILDRTTAPVLGQGEQVIGQIIVLRDVTEEHQAAQARELITGTLVHDLRSPVSAVLSAVDVMEELIPPEARDEIIDQALRVAHNGTTRVLGLIESLLDIARMQSGRMDLNLTPINLHGIVTNILVEFATQAADYQVNISNEVPENLPPVSADQSKITRVVNNLLDNALKFTPAGGMVEVSASLDEAGMVTMRICDTGPGIPAEFREKIFERFTQVPGQRGRRRGSGLGLTFCRMAIEAHGGRIWVGGRTGPLTGSVFTFTLPVSGPPKSTPAPAI